MIKNKNNRGYIALTSVIIVSFVLMSVVFSASLRGFQVRSTITDYYLKSISKNTAESCVEIARLKLADVVNYPLYEGNETLSIGTDECHLEEIELINDTPPKKVIRSVSTIGNSTTRLMITIDASTFSMLSWEEVLSF